jgi:hypothetical protein
LHSHVMQRTRQQRTGIIYHIWLLYHLNFDICNTVKDR